MTLTATAQTLTLTYVDGDWHDGNVALIGPRSHAMWLASSVFDGITIVEEGEVLFDFDQ